MSPADDATGTGPAAGDLFAGFVLRVIVPEDSALLREGITRIVDAQADTTVLGVAGDLSSLLDLVASDPPDVVIDRTPGFVLAGEAFDGDDAIAATEQLRPDLVLMDINLPAVSGVEATRRILARTPGTLVWLLSTYSLADLPASAAISGAAGYLHKEDFGPSELRRIWQERPAIVTDDGRI
jgi:DNA-binding NarL/FixJ family response regulator